MNTTTPFTVLNVVLDSGERLPCLVDTATWRLAFLINLPIVAAAALAVRSAPDHRAPAGPLDWVGALLSGLAVASAFVVLPFVGRDFFPQVDAGQFRLHVRAAPGLRLESTKVIFSRVEEELRKVIPASEIELILDNIGRSAESFNFAFGDGATIGTFDGEILVALKEGGHAPTEEYIRQLRRQLPLRFPELTFYFQPADIVSQVLNFGLPAPIDVQVAGYDPRNYDIARNIRQEIARVPGVVDAHVHQVMNGPDLHLEVDRTRAFRLSALWPTVSTAARTTSTGSTLCIRRRSLPVMMRATSRMSAVSWASRLALRSIA